MPRMELLPLPARLYSWVSTWSSPNFSLAAFSRVADGGDLGLGVGDLGDVDVLDDDRLQAGDFLGDEDALLVAAVRELDAGDDVADGVDVADAGVQALVGDDEAAVDGDAGLFVAEVGRDGAAADGDEQEVGLEGLAVHQGDLDAVVVLLDALEEDAGGELDAALLEGALKVLDDRGVLVRDQRRAGPRRW